MKSQNNLLFHVSAEDLKKIPGSPIAYWVSKQLKKCYDHDLISSIAFSDGQILTGNNDKYLRLLWEVDKNAILNHNWVLHAKGGEFRRWYGNIDSVVRFDPDTIAHYKKDPISRFPKEDILFRKGVTWSLVSSNPSFGVRFLDDSLTFNKAAATILFRDETFILYILGFLNTIIAQVILRIINPTINNNIKDVLSIPFFWEDSKKNEIESLVQKCIHFSSDDWNAYETSWEFQANPLVKEVALCKKDDSDISFAEVYQCLRLKWKKQTEEMRRLEIENNRLFIDIYGLQDELSPDVPWNEITLTCNPWYRYGKKPEEVSSIGNSFYMNPSTAAVRPTSKQEEDCPPGDFPFAEETENRLLEDTIKEFISYAVGCMFGRYSLDRPGLAFAGGAWAPSLDTTFPPDADNVIPILDEDWFADDIVGRFQEFLKVAFGEENYHENLAFVEAALGKDIRSYFTKDFYADHVKMYQKRPIYWLFSSPTGAFSALIYLHRYRPDTVGTVLTYLRSHITKVNAHIQEQEEIKVSAKASASMKSKAVREQLKMQHELQELEDYERDVLYPLSTERLEIDLDDGVKVNYPKFGKALRPIKGLDAKEE